MLMDVWITDLSQTTLEIIIVLTRWGWVYVFTVKAGRKKSIALYLFCVCVKFLSDIDRHKKKAHGEHYENLKFLIGDAKVLWIPF